MVLFNETTYSGRYKKYLELTNFRHLFHSNEKIEQCKMEVELTENPSVKCQYIYTACVHPTTKEISPFYGRMAMFVPINIPICAGMLLSKPVLHNLIGWQWINQTYNAVFNYSNSPKGESTKVGLDVDNPLLQGYVASVVVSVGLAVGLTQWVKKGKMPNSLRPIFQTVVPYVATASAGAANVTLMRGRELKTGIPVNSVDNQYLGHSKIAARKALFETAVSRAVLPIPLLLFPPPIIAVASRLAFFKSSVIRHKLMEITALVGTIFFGLPSALALYPQYTHISANELEPEIVESAQKLNVDSVKYNKGV